MKISMNTKTNSGHTGKYGLNNKGEEKEIYYEIYSNIQDAEQVTYFSVDEDELYPHEAWNTLKAQHGTEICGSFRCFFCKEKVMEDTLKKEDEMRQKIIYYRALQDTVRKPLITDLFLRTEKAKKRNGNYKQWKKHNKQKGRKPWTKY